MDFTEFQKQICQYMNQHSLSQIEFAIKTGTSQGTISAILRGAIPSRRTAEKIKTILGGQEND